jgi:hypothetical protein
MSDVKSDRRRVPQRGALSGRLRPSTSPVPGEVGERGGGGDVHGSLRTRLKSAKADCVPL